MKHRLLKWSLGSIAVTAPIASVVACSGSTDGLSDAEYQKRLSDLTSEEAQLQLEIQWLTMVLKANGVEINPEKPLDNPEILPLIKFFIAKELAKDSKYLSKFGQKLSGIIKNGENVYPIEDLKNWGLLNDYLYGYKNEIDNHIEKIAEILMKETSLGFANKIYQNLLVEKYLAITKDQFAQFRKLQDEREFNFTDIQKLINKDENFLLVQKLLEKKLFIKWEVQEKNESGHWVDDSYTKQKIDAALVQFNKSTTEGNITIADGANENVTEQTLAKQLWNIDSFKINIPGTDQTVEVDLSKYLGYKGTIEQPTASEKLDFSKVTLMHAKDQTYWTGILKEDSDAKLNELVTDHISFRDINNNLKGKLTLLFGIMPLYLNDELTMKGTLFEKQLNKLAWQVYANDEKIYNDVLKYYADEKKRGGQEIKIEVKDPAVRHIWKDVKKLIYVK